MTFLLYYSINIFTDTKNFLILRCEKHCFRVWFYSLYKKQHSIALQPFYSPVVQIHFSLAFKWYLGRLVWTRIYFFGDFEHFCLLRVYGVKVTVPKIHFLFKLTGWCTIEKLRWYAIKVISKKEKLVHIITYVAQF